MADSAEIVEPTSPSSGAAGPGGSARSAWGLVSSGITNQRLPDLVPGSVLTVTRALIMDRLGTLTELLLRPRSLEVD